MAGPPRPLPDRVRAKRGIVVGGVFSLLVAFELLLGMGCAFAVSVIHIAGPVQAQARSCVAEVSGHHAVVETATGGLDVDLQGPDGFEDTLASVREAVALSVSLARTCAIPRDQLSLEAPQGCRALGFVSSPLS